MTVFHPSLALPALLALASACATTPAEPSAPAALSAAAPTAPAAAVEPPGPGEDITLRQAAALALVRHPALAAYAWDVRVAEARVLQAGLRPNPVLSLEIEDLRWSEAPAARTRSYSLGTDGFAAGEERESGAAPGLGNAETTVSLSQVVELGGKRLKRVRLAQTERDLVEWDYEAARVDVLSGVARAFVELLGAQENLRLQAELAALAESVRGATQARVEAGKVSPLELTRAETELAAIEIAREAAARDVNAARLRLAAACGAQAPEFERAAGALEEAAAPPALETLEAAVEANPELARWTDETEQRLAALELARAGRVPDVEIAAGFRTRGVDDTDARGWNIGTDGTAASFGANRSDTRFSDSRENSVVLAASVPLPLFDRNQGAIREAEHRVEQAEAQRDAAELRVRSSLRGAHEELLKSAETARRIRDEILPRTTDAFERTQEGYREGKFGYLDVLYAQRTLFDVRRQYTQALIDYQTALADVERLVGQPLAELQPARGDTNGE